MTHDPYAALAELVACKDASPFNYRSTSAVNTDGKAEAEHYRREREAWSAARAALAQRAEPEPTITYAHKAAPDGPRFRQYPGDLLPVWAVDIRNEAAPQAQRAKPVAWQQRFIDPDEGLGVWQSCDDNTRRILQGRSDYELRPLYAAPQAQHVSGAADPAGHPAGEQTGPVSAAPTYTPQDAQPEPVSAADELQRPTTFHTEQSLADIAVAQEASLHKHAARSAAQPELLSDEQIRDLVKECGLDWHRGFAPLFDGDETNRYAVLARAIERAVTEQLRGQS